MSNRNRNVPVPRVLADKPLQAGKFVGILLSLVLGLAGFLRLVDASGFIDNPLLGDGQFLALLFVPLVSLTLVCVVFLETLVAGYRVMRSGASVLEQVRGRVGYVMLRGVEAGIAVLGVVVIAATLPVLFAESTPAPVGVGIMLFVLVVGVAILITSFVRSGAELLIYRDVA